MKNFYITILILLIPLAGFAQNIAEGDVTLTNQTEVNAFDYTEVTGTLTITGPYITNLSPLQSLERVGEHLIISYASNLENITGLENLEEVNCSLEFAHNGSLRNVNALPSLRRVGRDLVFYDNSLLASLDGIQDIDSLNNLRLVDNPRLNYCCFVNNLIESGAIHGSIYNTGNGSNCAASVLEGCTSEPVICEGDVYLFTQEEMDNFNCKIITGNLYLSSGWSLSAPPVYRDSLYKLEEVWGNVNASGIEIPGSFSGLSNLRYIGGNLEASILGFGGGSVNLNSIPNLEYVRGINLSNHYANGGLYNLTDTLEILRLAFSDLDDFSWVENLPSIDTIILHSSGARAEDLENVYSKLSTEGYLQIYEMDIEGFKGMENNTSLGSLICQFCFTTNLNGLINMEQMDSLNLTLDYYGPAPEGWEMDFCGIYNLFEGNPDISDYHFLVRSNEGELTINDILTNCATQEEVNAMTVYPNPAANQRVTLSWTADDSPVTRIELISPTGNLIAQETINSKAGQNKMEFGTQELKQGIYLIRVISGDQIKLQRLVIE